MTGDLPRFVKECQVCQTKKSHHTLTKGKLQFTQIPEINYSEISIDFAIDLPKSSRSREGILVLVDKVAG